MNESAKRKTGWRTQITKADAWVNRAINQVEESGFARFITIATGIIGFGVVVATALQIRADFADRMDEREYRRLDRIEAARSRLLARASGNTGKGEAFSFLISEGVPVDGIDLSCEAVGDWDFQKNTCRNAPILTGLNTTQDNGKPGINKILGIDLSDTKIVDAVINNTHIGAADLKRTKFLGVKITESNIYADLNGSQFIGCEINRSRIIDSYFDPTTFGINIEESLKIAFPEIFYCEVSGSILDTDYFELSKTRSAERVMAWADAPPLKDHVFKGELTHITSEEAEAVQLCEPPKDETGVLIAVIERGPISQLGCVEVPFRVAIERFPDAYAATVIQRRHKMDQERIH